MRFSFIILLFAALHVSAAVFSQKVSISGRDLSLSRVFEEIKVQTGYNFFYDAADVGRARTVSLNAAGAPLTEVLDECFRGQALTYRIIDRIIVVKAVAALSPEKPAPERPTAEKPDTTGIRGGVISGIIVDSTYSPLVDATIMIRGAKTGTQSDARGKFALKGTLIADSDVVIVVSYTGYETQQKLIHKGDMTAQFMVLHNSKSVLDEVEVVAYGTTTQRYNVGSVATVTSKDIERQPVNNPLEALQGRVAGLNVTVTNGGPGAMVLSQIRGQNTIPSTHLGGGGVRSMPVSQYDQPLYIIDGIPFAAQNDPIAINSLSGGSTGLSPLATINPLDIESMSVLKDADATAIYGSSGSNGVIIITTKKGVPGKMNLNVNVNEGPSAPSGEPQMMNSQQYLQMRREALANAGRLPTIDPNIGSDYDILLFDSTKSTNWVNSLFGKTAQHANTRVALSGGTNAINYLLSASYNYQSYNVPGDFAAQTTGLHSSINTRSANNRLTVTLVSDFSYTKNNSSTGTAIDNLVNLPPNFPKLVNKDGSLVWSYSGQSISSLSGVGANPYAALRQPADVQIYRINESMQLMYRVWKGLSIGGTFGYNRVDERTYGAIPIATIDPANHTLGSATFGDNPTDLLDIEPQLNYNQAVGHKGRMAITLGGTYQKSTTVTNIMQGNNYLSDALLNTLQGAAVLSDQSSNVVTKYVGSFGRVNFVWDERYIVNLTGNVNGSSLFGPGKRYGQFGSVGAGWIFSQTKLLQERLPWLSFGKLAGNYGLTGGNASSPYLYQPNWAVRATGQQYQGSAFYAPQNLFSPDYHWSTTRGYNGQLTLGFFHDWLVIEGSAYLKRSDDQLLGITLPSQAGFTSVQSNAPYTVQNSGWELTISPHPGPLGKNSNKLALSPPSLAFGRNNNKVLNIPPNSPYAAFYRNGQPVSGVMLVKYAGVDPATGTFQYYKADGKTKTTLPNDASAFQTINPGDANQLANIGTPVFNWGVGEGITWKGLSVNVFLQFVKQKGYNYLSSVYFNANGPGSVAYNEPAFISGKEWKKPGDQALLAKFNESGYPDITSSTAVVSDASYIRLSNLSVNYRLPERYIKKVGLKTAAVSINCQNLFTITGYKVGDPSTMSIYNIPPQRVISGGLNLNF